MELRLNSEIVVNSELNRSEDLLIILFCGIYWVFQEAVNEFETNRDTNSSRLTKNSDSYLDHVNNFSFLYFRGSFGSLLLASESNYIVSALNFLESVANTHQGKFAG